MEQSARAVIGEQQLPVLPFAKGGEVPIVASGHYLADFASACGAVVKHSLNGVEVEVGEDIKDFRKDGLDKVETVRLSWLDCLELAPGDGPATPYFPGLLLGLTPEGGVLGTTPGVDSRGLASDPGVSGMADFA